MTTLARLLAAIEATDWDHGPGAGELAGTIIEARAAIETVITWPVEFSVAGEPIPQGSAKLATFGPRCQTCGKAKFARIVSDNDHLAKWRSTVAKAALAAVTGRSPIRGQVGMEYVFVVPRPAHVPKGRLGPIVRPDLDKLVRAGNDALKGLAFFDDAQITDSHETKRYPFPDEPTGAIIRARPLDPKQERLPL